jgi:serine/threonine protein phosphatase PrpC
MWKLPDPRFDVASALDQGSRDYQEDALVTDFPIGDDCGIIVLADGMGGHAAGDVASNIIVTEVFGDLKFQRPLFVEREAELPDIMHDAALDANATLGAHVKSNPESRGMGTTLISVVMVGPNMFWTSVGDSPLFHYRGGRLRQLNEDHSMAPQIDIMVKTGMLKAEEARRHPDRNSLTSAIFGGTINRVDTPKAAFALETGDIVIVSSDGLQFMEDQMIARVVHRNRRKTSAEIANALLQAIKKMDDPEQDNISFAVVKVNHHKPVHRNQRPPVEPDTSELERLPVAATRLAREFVLDDGDDDEMPRSAAKEVKKAAPDDAPEDEPANEAKLVFLDKVAGE